MLRKLAFAAAATLFFLLLAEVALRLAGVASTRRGAAWYAGGNHPRFLFEPDPAAGYRLRPGFAGTEIARSGEFQTAVRIDQRGLRADGQAAAPGAAVALGDSMTFGEGVAAEEAWPAQLAARLGTPVLNAGVPGYSSRQMVARLSELEGELQPQLVIAGLAPLWDMQRCSNPFVYSEGYIVASSYAGRLHLVGEDLLLEQVRGPVLGPFSVTLMRHSHLVRLALPALRGAILARRETAGTPALADWEPCRDALVAAADATVRAGRSFLVLLAESPEAQSRAAADLVAAQLRERGVEVLRLDNAPGGADPSLRYPRDRHWNRAGHQWVAKALEPEIRARLSDGPSRAPAPTGDDRAP